MPNAIRTANKYLLINICFICIFAIVGCRSLSPSNSPNHSSCEFSFDIKDLVTNQQFSGQKNTFHVVYEYDADFHGSGIDPTGHPVAEDSYPYFQLVRNDIIKFVQEYPNKSAFYEIVARDLGQFVIDRYPQMRWVHISIDVPAFAAVDIDRHVIVTVWKNPTKLRQSGS